MMSSLHVLLLISHDSISISAGASLAKKAHILWHVFGLLIIMVIVVVMWYSCSADNGVGIIGPGFVDDIGGGVDSVVIGDSGGVESF